MTDSEYPNADSALEIIDVPAVDEPNISAEASDSANADSSDPDGSGAEIVWPSPVRETPPPGARDDDDSRPAEAPEPIGWKEHEDAHAILANGGVADLRQQTEADTVWDWHSGPSRTEDAVQTDVETLVGESSSMSRPSPEPVETAATTDEPMDLSYLWDDPPGERDTQSEAASKSDHPVLNLTTASQETAGTDEHAIVVAPVAALPVEALDADRTETVPDAMPIAHAYRLLDELRRVLPGISAVPSDLASGLMARGIDLDQLQSDVNRCLSGAPEVQTLREIVTTAEGAEYDIRHMQALVAERKTIAELLDEHSAIVNVLERVNILLTTIVDGSREN